MALNALPKAKVIWDTTVYSMSAQSGVRKQLTSAPYIYGLVGSMPLQFLEVGFHVEIHAIEWYDFQRETQFHGVVVA